MLLSICMLILLTTIPSVVSQVLIPFDLSDERRRAIRTIDTAFALSVPPRSAPTPWVIDWTSLPNDNLRPRQTVAAGTSTVTQSPITNPQHVSGLASIISWFLYFFHYPKQYMGSNLSSMAVRELWVSQPASIY